MACNTPSSPLVPQINVTIGTAGHIDHGKTSLVKCLTGCDTDRLKEEKARGMSIDLGYAPCTIGDMEVGIVDVPGHENFIKTMVAGASGMDAVLLVVAADDGVMPQTREHLEILTLLGIRHGMVALTKIDRVENESRDLVRSDVAEYLTGTFLHGVPMVSVSCLTGEGFDLFYEALFALVHEIRPKSTDGVFRLPLDRAFTVQGYGTVVSGIPVSGLARLDDEVELLPQREISRIRGIEVYCRQSDIVKAGQCAAINVRHFDRHSIQRGDTLAAPGYFSPHDWHLCQLRLLPRQKLVLNNGANVRFHTGTTEVMAALYAIRSDQLRSGDEDLVQIHTKRPVVTAPGDRFIVRTMTPMQTVGGGTIIESVRGKLRRTRVHAYQDLQERAAAVGEEARFVEYAAKSCRSLATSEAELAVRTKLPLSRVEGMVRALVNQKTLIPLGPKQYIHAETAATVCQQICEQVDHFHQQSPESPGLTRDQLRETVRLEKPVFDGLVEMLLQTGKLSDRDGRLASAAHRVTFRDEDATRLQAIEQLLLATPFQPPGPIEMASRMGVDPSVVKKMVKILAEHRQVVQLADEIVMHCSAVEQARVRLIDYIRREGRLESVKFKYLLDTTRKYALPLLDYFDKIGVTRRDGNTRYLKKTD